MRRTLIIVAGAIVVIGLIIMVYFAFFAEKSPTLTTGDNPFDGTGSGDTGGSASPEGDSGPVNVTGAGKLIAPKLVRITDGPVAAGVAVFYVPPPKALATTSTSTSASLGTIDPDTEVRYLDRASGNMYAYRVHDRSLARITNRTLPGVLSTSWLSDGSLVFVQYLSKDVGEEVETYALPADGRAEGYRLESGISQVAVNGTSTVFTLRTASAGSTGTFTKPDGTNARTVFTSPLSSLVMHFAGAPLLVYTKPSASASGYAFTIDATRNFTRVLGPLPALSVLPNPDGEQYLFSYATGGSLRLALMDTKTRAVTNLPLATLAEKCAWSAGGRTIYCMVPKTLPAGVPDTWYQGAVHTEDRLWAIDLFTRNAQLLVDPNKDGVTVDAADIAVDDRSDALVFRNRVDSSLYAYDL